MDGSGTKATEDRLEQLGKGLENGATDETKENQENAVPINENLFLDEDLDEELQNLDLED